MSKDTRNYYERELEQIDFNGEHPANILVGSEGKTTRALDINRESAVALIHRLTDFLLTPAPEPKEESAAPFERPHVNYTTGRDRNGNKTLRCSSREGAFTVQTNGNLPQTHRDGVTSATDAEVCAYVRGLGNERRRRILGI